MRFTQYSIPYRYSGDVTRTEPCREKGSDLAKNSVLGFRPDLQC